jgi:hypothetical protein
MNRRALILTGLLAIGCAAAFPHFAAATPEKTAAAAPLEVTYFYLPT